MEFQYRFFSFALENHFKICHFTLAHLESGPEDTIDLFPLLPVYNTDR